MDVLGGGVSGYLCFIVKIIDRKVRELIGNNWFSASNNRRLFVRTRLGDVIKLTPVVIIQAWMRLCLDNGKTLGRGRILMFHD